MAEELLEKDNAPDAEQRAVDLLFEAIDKNSLKALYVLGQFYLEKGADSDRVAQGLAMLKEASALGHDPSSRALYTYYSENGDLEQAKQALEPLAEKGNVFAHLRLAELYAFGPEALRNRQKAKSHLDAVTASAASAKEAAQRTAGLRIRLIREQLETNVADQDAQEIVAELTTLSNENILGAIKLLSQIYLEGLPGVDYDPSAGLGLLAKSAELGDAGSAYFLGRYYYTGKHTERDVARGIALIEEAAANDQTGANIFLATLALAGDYDKMNREAAEDILSTAADEGNSAASVALSKALAEGKLGEERSADAVKRARQAAEGGAQAPRLLLAKILIEQNGSDAKNEAVSILEELAAEEFGPAVVALIEQNLSGEHLPRDEAKAEKYIRVLTGLDFKPAKMFLANLYLSGVLLEPNPVLGVRLLTEEFESGNDAAVVPYARLFIDGEFVEQDPARGVEILAAAAQAGNRNAKQVLAGVLLQPDKDYSNKSKGYALLEEVVGEAKSAFQPFRLGMAYLRGDGVEENTEKAIAYLNQANDLGHKVAPFILGQEYLRGSNVERNYRTARAYFETAVERGEMRGYLSLGDIYLRSRQNDRAIEAYKAAAENGFEGGQVKIGLAYMNTARFPGRQAEGLKLLNDLSEAGNAEASINLARIFRKGQLSMPVDVARALAYYDAAVATGNEQAEGHRLSLLAEVNAADKDLANIATLFDELPDAGKRTFVFTSFDTSEKQIAYVVQSKLSELDYYQGALDGLFGSGSQSAMLLFCKDDAFNGPCATPIWSRENAIRVLQFSSEATN